MNKSRIVISPISIDMLKDNKYILIYKNPLTNKFERAFSKYYDSFLENTNISNAKNADYVGLFACHSQNEYGAFEITVFDNGIIESYTSLTNSSSLDKYLTNEELVKQKILSI